MIRSKMSNIRCIHHGSRRANVGNRSKLQGNRGSWLCAETECTHARDGQGNINHNMDKILKVAERLYTRPVILNGKLLSLHA